MIRKSPSLNDLLALIVEHIDIPPSLYEKAAARHRSLGEFLSRDSSAVKHLGPDVRPQGSFRLGLVIRPLFKDDEYDLDNICVLAALGTQDVTQQELKRLYGEELREYARQHNMLHPLEECHRCWRLRYADEVSFHLDSLPCIPGDPAAITRLELADVPEELAQYAVSITDRRHPHYKELSMAWQSSNPRGFAAWFERKAKEGRANFLIAENVRATVEDVPPFHWKTPLQRSIQLLKRHRDVMFRTKRELAPISMIITNLAARAYEGEQDVATTLTNIVAKMPMFVRAKNPRVPNPADPAEDYADKWSRDPRLEHSFWEWYYTVKSDLAGLPRYLRTNELAPTVERAFEVSLTQEEQRVLGGGNGPSIVTTSGSATFIASDSRPPRPWGD